MVRIWLCHVGHSFRDHPPVVMLSPGNPLRFANLNPKPKSEHLASRVRVNDGFIRIFRFFLKVQNVHKSIYPHQKHQASTDSMSDPMVVLRLLTVTPILVLTKMS